jgi:hypothetical protein
VPRSNQLNIGSAGASVHEGIALLLRAWRYAREVSRPVREFAIEIQRLRNAGLDECELRRLLCQGRLEHLVETALPGQKERTFVKIESIGFCSESCFALTEQGVEFATELVNGGIDANGNWSATARIAGSRNGRNRTPVWDASNRKLTVGRRTVKAFRVPAKQQELVLNAFQKAAWPKRLDCPFPIGHIDGTRRLRAVIDSLNRNQRQKLIHFFGDGYGTGICLGTAR